MIYDYRIVKNGDSFIAQRRLKTDKKDTDNLEHYWNSIHEMVVFNNIEYIDSVKYFNVGTTDYLNENQIKNHYSQSLTDAVNRVKEFREQNEPLYALWEPNIFLRLFKKDIIPVIDEKEGKIFNVRAKKQKTAYYRLPRTKR